MTLEKIKEIRAAIRSHRDARGDDRCWLDDYHVWNAVGEGYFAPPDFPDPVKGMEQCRAYYRFRQASTPEPAPDSVINPVHWDDDLAAMDESGLVSELDRLRRAVAQHRDITDRPRTIDDDRALYAALPETAACDFRLPPEPDFLGEAKAPHAGCPSFWRSHSNCPAPCHDIHVWGPCRK